MEPYAYLDANPGKEIRSELIHSFNEWLHVPEAKLEVIRKVVRMLHTASLLMDDVEDNSDLRRGVPVAHRIYGIPQTINTANYVYFLVFQEIFHLSQSPSSYSSPNLNVEKMVTEEMINLHRGQGMDLFWRDSLTCPTEEEYVEMVCNKTGGLFRIALKLMLAHSPHYTNPEQLPDLLPLADLIGLLFQIRDDYMNLQSSKYADNKGFAEDLTEGKFSFPIIHAVRNSSAPITPTPSSNAHFSAPRRPEKLERSSTPLAVPSLGSGSSHAKATSATSNVPNRQILNVLKQRPTDLATKQYAVSYMRNVTHSFNYTRNVMRRLDRQAVQGIQKIRDQYNQHWEADRDTAPTEDRPCAGEGAERLLKILAALRADWYDAPDDL